MEPKFLKMPTGHIDSPGKCSLLPLLHTPHSCLTHPLHDTLCLPGAYSNRTEQSNLGLAVYLHGKHSIKEREIFTLKYLIKMPFRDEWIGKSKHFIFIK